MSNKNWGVVLVVGGLLAALTLTALGTGYYAAALNYPKQERYQTYRYAPGDPEAARAALADQSKPVEYRQPCKEPEGRDESDLCAQWKAARAAESGALWAARAFWIGIVSAFGIIAALLLALDSNRIARDTAKAQLRAYVSIKPKRLEMNPATGEAKFHFSIRNDGNTPAYKLIAHGNIVVGPEAEIERQIARDLKRKIIGRVHPTTLAGGGGKLPANEIPASRKFAIEEIKALIKDEVALFAFGIVEYEDAFGCERKTEFCLKAEVSFPEPVTDPKEPVKVDMRWVVAPFHNNHT